MSFVTNTKQLKALCQSLAKEPYITVDTEFIRETTYWPNLCLIQVAGAEEAKCIDPLADDIDLEPFWDLMDNKKVLKVFHAARQDLEIFHHLHGKLPNPLYDTQIAAMVCGFGDSVGYDTLVAKITGTQIDKSSRFTDWARRPLTEKQYNYALADVTHLRVVYEALAEKVAKANRAHWLDEEMAVLNAPGTYVVEPEEAWLRLKPRITKPRFLAILREVAAWREKEAQARDIPRGRLLRDEALEEIASHPPEDLQSLLTIRGVPSSWSENKIAQSLLKAVKIGVDLPIEDAPKADKKDHIGHYSAAVVELLKVLLRHICDENNVAAKLVASVSDLEKIAASDKAEVPALSGWRRELFGNKALALKGGHLALAIKKQAVQVIDLRPAE
jgi:ribonuclease D